MNVRIEDITIEKRARKDLGDIITLSKSIESLGLLQPVGVTKEKVLLFGHRRVQACKALGWETIPARIFEIDADDRLKPLKMEQHENEYRKEMTPSEKVAIAEKIEEALKGRWGGDRTKVPDLAPCTQGKSRDIAADAVGMKPELYRQAKAITKTGNDEAIQRIDSGEPISRVYNETVKKKPQPKPEPKRIKITLCENPIDDAMQIIQQAGGGYAEKLGMAILKYLGHKVEVE